MIKFDFSSTQSIYYIGLIQIEHKYIDHSLLEYWLFILVAGYQSFKEICSLHLHDKSSTLKTEEQCSSEMLVLAYKSAVSYFQKTVLSMPTIARMSHLT